MASYSWITDVSNAGNMLCRNYLTARQLNLRINARLMDVRALLTSLLLTVRCWQAHGLPRTKRRILRAGEFGRKAGECQ